MMTNSTVYCSSSEFASSQSNITLYLFTVRIKIKKLNGILQIDILFCVDSFGFRVFIWWI